jgi:cytochrome b pre-mRNA-processing protein 3
MSFLLIKIKYKDKVPLYKEFYQKLFDHVFIKIELNFREIGYGDVSVNKNMKFLVKVFYDILINCENYKEKSLNSKKLFFNKYLKHYTAPKTTDNADLVKYFDQYQAFCFDLNSYNVLKGDVNFNYK